MATWYPSVITYHQWQQAESFKEDIETVVKAQTNEIVASQAQTRQVISERFNRIANVNAQGFQSVTNAIESLHADFNYYGGAIVQELEIQSGILNDILYPLKNPLKTQVEEFYSDGCRLVQEGILDKAIEKFTKAIQLDDTSFMCYYQFGLLYLNGKTEDENVINVSKANRLLVTACRFGKGKARADQNFKPVVANTLFFTSLSFYYQLDSPQPSELLDNAINYAEEALAHNANLSQAAYHLAKYYSIREQTDKMLIYLRKAIEMDLDYLFEVNNEKAFDRNSQAVNSLLSQMREEKRKESQELLDNVNINFSQLSAFKFDKAIEGTIYEDKLERLKGEFIKIKEIISSAIQNHQLNTYFGYLDTFPITNKANEEIKVIMSKLKDLEFSLKRYIDETKRLSNPSREFEIEIAKLGGGLGLFLGFIIGFIGCVHHTVKYPGGSEDGFGIWVYSTLICMLIGVVGIFLAVVSRNLYEYYSFLNQNKKK